MPRFFRGEKDNVGSLAQDAKKDYEVFSYDGWYKETK